MTDAGSYFADAGGTPDKPGRFVEVAPLEGISFITGLEFRAVVGDAIMVSFATYQPHTQVPRHAHGEEQISLVLEGEWEFDLDGDVRRLGPGTAIVIPSYVPHAARYLRRQLRADRHLRAAADRPARGLASARTGLSGVIRRHEDHDLDSRRTGVAR